MVARKRKVRKAAIGSWREEGEAVVSLTPGATDCVARLENEVIQPPDVGKSTGGKSRLTSPDDNEIVNLGHQCLFVEQGSDGRLWRCQCISCDCTAPDGSSWNVAWSIATGKCSDTHRCSA